MARYLRTTGWAHAVMLSMGAVFLFPFVWMVATSIKTDDEMASTSMWPKLPIFQPASPYARAIEDVTRPAQAPEQAWRDLEPALRSLTTDAVALSATAEPVDRPAWIAGASARLLAQTCAKLPKAAWTSPREEALADYRALLTPEAVAAALDDRLARLELRGLQLRTLDGHIISCAQHDDFATKARIESGEATLRAVGDATRLDYRFSTTDARPVVLAFPLMLPVGFAASDLHKIILSMKADDTWHRLDATVDIGGTRYESRRSTYLAKHRAVAIVFQPPTFDDQTSRARTWVPLRAAARTSGDADSTAAILRITLTPSSTSSAVWGKVRENYARAFNSVPFWTYVINSVILVVLTMAGAMFSSAFVAYAFARLKWPGRSLAFILLLSTMMLPSQVTMIPSFLIWRELGWYNTLNPLWVPAWFGNAFFIFLMVQQMKTIPRELEEAARIDGLNAVQTWWYIIVPQVKPTLAGIAIMSFMGSWNDFMGPLIYLRDQSKFPLSLGLFGVSLEHGGDWSMIMAGNILMTLPVILIFFCFQRYFIQGMTVTGMK
ncbi:MAG: ABC transporter permease subunit [Planctomycetes bacterium]|nr:ABC transporter permease subunit [Planctomycetota bacterium]